MLLCLFGLFDAVIPTSFSVNLDRFQTQPKWEISVIGWRFAAENAPMRFTWQTVVLTGVLTLGLQIAAADDWPCWRGPNHNDAVSEHSGWSKAGWKLGTPVWSCNVGEGSTSPIVVQGRLYTMGWAHNHDTVQCLDAAGGKVLWTASYNSPRYGRHSTGDKRIYSSTSSTPTFDLQTGLLFTLGIDGDLICWNTRKKGRRVWSINFYNRYKIV